MKCKNLPLLREGCPPPPRKHRIFSRGKEGGGSHHGGGKICNRVEQWGLLVDGDVYHVEPIQDIGSEAVDPVPFSEIPEGSSLWGFWGSMDEVHHMDAEVFETSVPI